MSLNPNLALKILLGTEIRKVQTPPSNIAGLRQVLRDLYGREDFRIRYMDEENDPVVIETDQELATAYQSCTGPCLKILLSQGGQTPSEYSFRSEREEPKPRVPPMKIVSPDIIYDSESSSASKPEECKAVPVLKPKKEKVGKNKGEIRAAYVKNLVKTEIFKALNLPDTPIHRKIQCDECLLDPIVGIRYQCTICPDYNLCQVCEASTPHPHPFLKVRDPAQSIRPTDWKAKRKMMKQMQKGGKCRMDFVDHGTGKEEMAAAPGEEVYKTWVVKNSGDMAWPEGTNVAYMKGDIISENYPVPPLNPGEEAEIGVNVKVPNVEGRYHNIYRLLTPTGQKFGEKLHLKAQVKRGDDPREEQVAQLEAMGFTNREEILKLMEELHGDVNLVASKLLRQ